MHVIGKVLVTASFVGLVSAACTVETTYTPPEQVGVSQQNVERTVQDVLEAEVGQRPDAVECDTGVDAVAGESVRCVLSAGGTQIGLTATVVSVDGDDVRMDVQVDDQPLE